MTKYLHGSSDELPVGLILKGRGEAYKKMVNIRSSL